MRKWYLNDGESEVGPNDEPHVLRMIRAGLPEDTLIRAEGTDAWRGLRSHAPFAMALEKRARQVADQPTSSAGADPQPGVYERLRSAPLWAQLVLIFLGIVVPGLTIMAIVVALRSAKKPPATDLYEDYRQQQLRKIEAEVAARKVTEAEQRKRAEEQLPTFRKMSPDGRETAIADCFLRTGRCTRAELETIGQAGTTPEERAHLARVTHAWWAYNVARGVSDNSEFPDWVPRDVVAEVAKTGIRELLKLPRTTHAEVVKDPIGERGKIVEVVGGTVSGIERRNDVFTGYFGSGDRYYFVTPGQTRGIVDGSKADFVGVVAQKRSAARSTWKTVIIVGRFRGQADSDL